LVAVIDVPADGVQAFRRYEATVVAMMARYGGVMEQRLASDDGTFEIHVLSFPSRREFDRYLADPLRSGARDILETSGAQVRVEAVVPVQPGSGTSADPGS
jgi:hypothetical protein